MFHCHKSFLVQVDQNSQRNLVILINAIGLMVFIERKLI